MSNQASVSSGGFPFFSILTLIFITLKLTGYIGWSWWWVLAPTLIPFALMLVFLVLAFLIAVAAGMRR